MGIFKYSRFFSSIAIFMYLLVCCSFFYRNAENKH